MKKYGHIVLLPFLASRLVFAAAAFFGQYFSVRPQSSDVLSVFFKWDATWYVRIALRGYENASVSNHDAVAFFPLYPLLIRFLTGLVPGNAKALAPWVAILLSNALAVYLLIVLHRWVEDTTGNERLARRTVWLFLAYPASMFLTLGYTESLYILLLISTISLTSKGLMGWASLTGFLLATSRPTGVLLIPSLLWLGVENWRKDDKRQRMARLGGMAALGLGFLAVAWHAAHISGEPFAIFKVQGNWGRHLTSPLQTFISPVYPEPHVDVFNRLAVMGFIILTGYVFLNRTVRWLGPYVLLSIFPVVFSGTLMSATRLMYPQIPCFVVAAMMLRHSDRFWMANGLLFGVQALMVMCWTAGRFVA